MTVVLTEAGLSDFDVLHKATGGREQDFYFVAFDLLYLISRTWTCVLEGIIEPDSDLQFSQAMPSDA